MLFIKPSEWVSAQKVECGDIVEVVVERRASRRAVSVECLSPLGHFVESCESDSVESVKVWKLRCYDQ